MDNVYQIVGDKTLIFTTYKGEPRAALIDREDLDAVASVEGKWMVDPDNRFFWVDRTGEVRKTIYLHDLIICAFSPRHRSRKVAHINGDAADNRKGNLMFLKD